MAHDGGRCCEIGVMSASNNFTTVWCPVCNTNTVISLVSDVRLTGLLLVCCRSFTVSSHSFCLFSSHTCRGDLFCWSSMCCWWESQYQYLLVIVNHYNCIIRCDIVHHNTEISNIRQSLHKSNLQHYFLTSGYHSPCVMNIKY